VLPEYSLDEEAPSYDAQSSSLWKKRMLSYTLVIQLSIP
jgi:hypothetical protein